MITLKEALEKVDDFIEVNAEKMSSKLVTLTEKSKRVKSGKTTDKLPLITELGEIVSIQKASNRQVGYQAQAMLGQLAMIDAIDAFFRDDPDYQALSKIYDPTQTIESPKYITALVMFRAQLEYSIMSDEELSKRIKSFKEFKKIDPEFVKVLNDIFSTIKAPSIQVDSKLESLAKLATKYNFASKAELSRELEDSVAFKIVKGLYDNRGNSDVQNFVRDNKDFMVKLAKDYSLKLAKQIFQSTTLLQNLGLKTKDIGEIIYAQREEFYLSPSLAYRGDQEKIAKHMIKEINTFLENTNYTLQDLIKDKEVRDLFMSSKSLQRCLEYLEPSEKKQKERGYHERKEEAKEKPEARKSPLEETLKPGYYENVAQRARQGLVNEAIKHAKAGTDLYVILGVDKNATPKQIDFAWKKASVPLQKDTPENNEKRQKLNEAKEILSDDTVRKAYDQNFVDVQARQAPRHGK